MYKNAYYDSRKNMIYVWDDEKGLIKEKFVNFSYKPVTTTNDYKYLMNKKLSLVKANNDNNGLEKDVNIITKYLIEKYSNTENIIANMTTMYFDIEVESSKEFPNYKNPFQKILSIAFYIDTIDKYYILLLDEENIFSNVSLREDVKLLRYNTEKELILSFIKMIRKFEVDILTGWNIVDFDIPYLWNRGVNICGINKMREISPINKVYIKDKYKYEVKIVGISVIDYMLLYKNITPNVEISYSLDNISKKILGEGKIKYDGSLDNLYKKDTKKFIEYNINDVELIVKLEKKLTYLNIAKSVTQNGLVLLEDFFYPTRWLEGSSLKYLHRKKIISPNKPLDINLRLRKEANIGDDKLFVFIQNKDVFPIQGQLKVEKSKTSNFILKYKYVDYENEIIYLQDVLKEKILFTYRLKLGFQGAFIKQPYLGVHKYIFDLDLTSLYPSIIRMLNISIETYIGNILDWDNLKISDLKTKYKDRRFKIFFKNKKIKEYSGLELFNIFQNYNIHVSANGVLYDVNNKGFMPEILTNWFNERKKYKKLRDEAFRNGDKDKYLIYDITQKRLKISLNAFYGATSVPSFRYYYPKNAEAVTSTGRLIIKKSAEFVNEFFYNKIGIMKDYVIYTDTDSLFISSLPLIKDWDKLSDDEILNKTLEIANEIQSYINEKYFEFAKDFFNVKEKEFMTLNIKQELVAISSYFDGKKRYIIQIIYDEGKKLLKPKLKATGIEIVRSDYPELFRDLFNKFFNILLNGNIMELNNFVKNAKNIIKDANERNIFSILLNSGVNGLDIYDINRQKFSAIKGTPSHVKSALFYNDMLNEYKLNNFPEIKNGDKILYAKLKPNPYGIDVLAIKTNNTGQYPIEILNYIKKYNDWESIYHKLLEDKFRSVYDKLNYQYPGDKLQLSLF